MDIGNKMIMPFCSQLLISKFIELKKGKKLLVILKIKDRLSLIFGSKAEIKVINSTRGKTAGMVLVNLLEMTPKRYPGTYAAKEQIKVTKLENCLSSISKKSKCSKLSVKSTQANTKR
jgi:hypothetical protein